MISEFLRHGFVEFGLHPRPDGFGQPEGLRISRSRVSCPAAGSERFAHTAGADAELGIKSTAICASLRASPMTRTVLSARHAG